MIRILVVDDDESIREIVRIMLKDFEVIEASNGLEGIKLYEKIKPDIVLMDINMPIMDGVEATKQILNEDPNAIIIGLTAFARSRGKELLEAGAKGIIEKPFTRKSIKELIEPFIAKTIL
ncbi:MAG: response regulator [Archaeoglobaceae archaeon]|nr:response regulator [Archaeoglobaceae archaeon]MDW8128068.1 response regulator [Archaeoglobaceae archaeon]